MISRLFKSSRRVLAICLAMFAVFGSFTFSPAFAGDFPGCGDSANRARKWVDSVFNSLSPEERLGQLYMVDLSSKWTPQDKSFQNILSYIDSCHIGGVIFFYGGPVRQANLHNNLQARSKVPLMVAIDGEWGLSMRLDSVPSFPRNLTLGAISNNSLIQDMGREIGRECRRMGINIDFMPCVDIYDNLANPVIANRSFGSNKLNVAYKGLSILQGMQATGVLTTLKHFPGHGNTVTDSHEALPVIRDSYNTLDTLDMFPFKYMIRRGAEGVMVGHLLVPAMVGSSKSTPASISPEVIKGVLRDSLKFQGLVFTDALQMKGISATYDSGEAELRAFQAGVDVFLMPVDCIKSFRYMQDAISRGVITQQQVDEKCRKILYAKYKMGLADNRFVNTDGLIKDLNSRHAANLNRTILENAITLIKNDSSLLPLPIQDPSGKPFALLTITSDGHGNEFESTFCKFTNNLHIYRIAKNAKEAEYKKMLTTLQDYDLVVIGLHSVSAYPSRFGFNAQMQDFVQNIISSKKVILDIFNSPVALTKIENYHQASAIVVSYEDSEQSCALSAKMILGYLPFKGKLPVALSREFPEGKSIATKPHRMEMKK